jgi:hypothetical protein
MKSIGAALVGLVLFGSFAGMARAGHVGWAIGINLGAPWCYRPWYPCYYAYGYYPSYPVYVPPPVVLQPAPVVQPVQVAQPVYAPPARGTAPTTVPAVELERNLQMLRSADDNARIEAVLALGRMHATQALDAVAATLAGDRSPAVREAAARALGIMGAPPALPSLQHAAQLDSDRDVRHSAQFAIEVIQAQR